VKVCVRVTWLLCRMRPVVAWVCVRVGSCPMTRALGVHAAVGVLRPGQRLLLSCEWACEAVGGAGSVGSVWCVMSAPCVPVCVQGPELGPQQPHWHHPRWLVRPHPPTVRASTGNEACVWMC
jgi:hypothetical protein